MSWEKVWWHLWPFW